ncbi:winged helix-turn-helix transcriptional regulator [Nocardia macrotermitis]|uniref:Putative HTH-type transcriptional regulator YtcD n=1 Tax=Nocardia macrotermitis TaxID=2585198 RepID=A0A7K0D3J1_9NOCA|nr:helix-turn-helix domain-containing protein [Nocardia macrotermitis]MQY20303.1 putative HTH-type transcriptional regulator YtcD [Nocardia macrotermitis]
MNPDDEQRHAHDIALRVFAVVSTKWALRVLEEIDSGRHRFRELHRAVQGISFKMLTQTLRDLENHGLITRFDHHTPNPHVDYTLTTPGTELLTTVHTLCTWSRTHLDHLLATPAHRPEPTDQPDVIGPR